MYCGKLDSTVNTILNQYEEDIEWSVYCAIISNPFAEDVGSFDEFKKRFSPQGHDNADRQSEQGMSTQQIKAQMDNADKILSGFVPPVKGGG